MSSTRSPNATARTWKPRSPTRRAALPRSASPSPAARAADPAIPMIEGTVTARQGTHLADPGGTMPAAALSTCVGGMGAHWTCATPRPYGSERIDFIQAAELDALLQAAERLLSTT